ncbi:MAG: NAD-dependent epimerase/dehydratase family protein [Atopobiaceae bacterium]
MLEAAGKQRIWLVTGGTGYLGSTIVRKLVKKGERVRVFSLPHDRGLKYLPEEAEVVFGDLTSKESLAPFFDVPAGTETVVLHIASMVSVNPDFDQRLMDINIGGTKNVIALAQEHPECRMLVYCSSTGAIPELPKGQKISEVDHFDPEAVVGCYSQSKAIATQAVLDAAHAGLPACVVHPSGILGPGDYAKGEVTGTLIQIVEGALKGGIDGSFNLCDVRDLADATIATADRGRSGECYILANEPVTFKDFARMIAEATGQKPPRLFLPLWLAGLLAKAAERKAAKTGKKPLLTSFSIYNLARNNSFDSSKAKRELGYQTRPYEETIRDEIAWMKDAGMIGASAPQSAPAKAGA